MVKKKKVGAGKRKASPARQKRPASAKKVAQPISKPEKESTEPKEGVAGTSQSRKRSSLAKDPDAKINPEGKSDSAQTEVEDQESIVEIEEEIDEDEDIEFEEDEDESGESSLEEEEEGDLDLEEQMDESDSTIAEIETQTATTTQHKRLSKLTPEEKLVLMHRRDSELTYPQMIEKDILWYDLLTGEGEEELMGSETEFVEPESELPLMNLEDEQTEEELEDGEDEEGEEEEESVVETREETPAERSAIETDADDADNFANLVQVEDEEGEGLELLYMEASEPEPDTQSISTFPGVVGINLTDATLQWFEITDIPEKKPPYAYISFKRVKLHMYIYQEASEFYPFRDLLMHYPDFAILVGVDSTKATGHSHFMCTSLEGRNMVINPPKAKKQFLNARKKEEEIWKKLMSIVPRKWKTLGSEVEVDLETKYAERSMITMHAYRYIEAFNRPYEFTDTPHEKNKNAYAAFDSVNQEKMPLLEISEMDIGIQVMPPKIASSTQTGFSFKRNKICQYENQFLDPESVKVILQKPASGLVKKTRALQRALLQNEMMNLAKDDYKYGLKAAKGHDVEYSEQSIVLEEYQTYCDATQSKGRCVTWMTFHPTLEDVVVISLAEGVTFDKRIDLHSKMLMDPNFVLFWDLKDPSHPQIMLDAPSDVFSFMINPSDPQILSGKKSIDFTIIRNKRNPRGGCANGQIVLWDLGREYIELRARLQDRRRKVKDKESSGLVFLDKLKDKTEIKYSCPLIAPVGLSNLDQSHKNVVTSVCWLPAHVELGKNGNLYENLSGSSYQFFSTGGDGTVRIWDIRPPKLGLDEYDAIPSDIRSNVYLHLENNNWKYSNKFFLDDGTGSGALLATILSLSEPRQSDIISFDALTRSEAAKSDATLTTSSGTSEPQDPSSDQAVTSQKPPSEVNLKPRNTLLPNLTTSGTAILDEVDVEVIANRKAAGMLNVLGSVQSSIFIGSIIGQVGLVDWLRNKDGPINPEGGQRMFYNIYVKTLHDGAITSITRSPFYYNLILVVGGGTISIWKETSSQPLLAMTGGDQFPWCGCWSNTRPAVFFVGTREGYLHIWDLMEKGHAPVLLQQISPDRITNVAIPKAKLGKKQFLALSDSVGNVFVMLLSGYYYKPNKTENAFMMELMTREEKRHIDWTAQADDRREKMESINTAWKESKVTKTDEEIYVIESEVEARLNSEYKEFLEFETKIASRLRNDAPSLSVESLDVDFKFDELLAAAKHRDELGVDDNEEDEDDPDERENSSEDSPLGSEYEFLLRDPEPPIQLHRKSTSESQAQESDSPASQLF